MLWEYGAQSRSIKLSNMCWDYIFLKVVMDLPITPEFYKGCLWDLLSILFPCLISLYSFSTLCLCFIRLLFFSIFTYLIRLSSILWLWGPFHLYSIVHMMIFFFYYCTSSSRINLQNMQICYLGIHVPWALLHPT